MLVDASADVLAQLEREGVDAGVDALVVTHTHADHILGLEDLVRARPEGLPPLTVLAAPYHQTRIAEIFPGLVREGRARLRFGDWRAGTVLSVGPVRLAGFETGHRDTFPTTAVLLEAEVDGQPRRIAYATDMGVAPAETTDRLRGIDLLVADGTYPGTEGHGHPGSREIVRGSAALGVRRLVFTHVGHVGLDDATLRSRFGPGVGVAQDGVDLFDLLPTA